MCLTRYWFVCCLVSPFEKIVRENLHKIHSCIRIAARGKQCKVYSSFSIFKSYSCLVSGLVVAQLGFSPLAKCSSLLWVLIRAEMGELRCAVSAQELSSTLHVICRETLRFWFWWTQLNPSISFCLIEIHCGPKQSKKSD